MFSFFMIETLLDLTLAVFNNQIRLVRQVLRNHRLNQVMPSKFSPLLLPHNIPGNWGDHCFSVFALQKSGNMSLAAIL